ncbi:MAG: DoxX family protein [Chitinophagaceae bacterium]
MFFSSSPVWQTSGLTLIRLTLGGFLIYHGWEIFNEVKINEYLAWDNFKQSNGKLLVYAGKAAELLAGILFVLGLFTRIASLLTIGTMCYITFMLGNGIIWNNDQHPFLFVLLALVFFFTGAGRFSLDQYLFSKKSLYR